MSVFIAEGFGREKTFPALVVDMKKLRRNLETVTRTVKDAGCSVMIVTKCFCASGGITGMLLESSAVDYLADSRIQNIKTYSGKGKETVLLRLPQRCEIEAVIRYADISFNSEVSTLEWLNAEAERQGRTHKVVLMIDLGDLREGLYYTEDKKILSAVETILNLKNLQFCGISTNLTCYGAIIPSKDNLSILSGWAERIKEKFDTGPLMVSGGNSSSYYLAEKGELPDGINNLRLGEAFILGNETAYGKRIKNTSSDAVTLEAQIIEVQTKASVPEGESGVDAFGEKPVFQDRGLIRRALLAIGRQDTDPAGLFHRDAGISVLGASSDHLILDISGAERRYRVGETVSFTLSYGAALRAFTGVAAGFLHTETVE
ncbi:MAG: alanine/ornithine racemase family PLP-dependent enzyme [Spirochaetaceae bacterium]|jgi:predicted amino acid racemase|nr:alanine/ornithine racemase family PLP-dependent enzyme [Spirochaetaceae bacterium]